MTSAEFAVSIVEYEQWLDHDRAGGAFIVLLSMSIGPQRAVGPFATMMEAFRAAAIAQTGIANVDDVEMAISVQVVPMFTPEEAL